MFGLIARSRPFSIAAFGPCRSDRNPPDLLLVDRTGLPGWLSVRAPLFRRVSRLRLQAVLAQLVRKAPQRVRRPESVAATHLALTKPFEVAAGKIFLGKKSPRRDPDFERRLPGRCEGGSSPKARRSLGRATVSIVPLCYSPFASVLLAAAVASGRPRRVERTAFAGTPTKIRRVPPAHAPFAHRLLFERPGETAADCCRPSTRNFAGACSFDSPVRRSQRQRAPAAAAACASLRERTGKNVSLG